MTDPSLQSEALVARTHCIQIEQRLFNSESTRPWQYRPVIVEIQFEEVVEQGDWSDDRDDAWDRAKLLWDALVEQHALESEAVS